LDGQTPAELTEPLSNELSDRWLISRYHQIINQTTHSIDNYGLGEAAKGLYEFIWGDFCDWYIELAKSRLQPNADPISRRAAQQTLASVLEGILKLLHPFMPHITEEIWQTLTQQPADSRQTLALQAYPKADRHLIDPALEEQFELVIGTIRTIRNLRAEADVKPGAKVQVNLQTDSAKEQQILTAGQSYIKDLAKVESLLITGEQKSQTVASPKQGWGWKTIGLIVVGLVFARIGLAVGNTVYHIPIVGTSLEIVGLGYSIWFIFRSLLSAKSTPKEPQTVLVAAPEQSITGVIGTVQVVIPLIGVVDIEGLRAKLERSLSKIQAEAQSLKGRLSNPIFVDKAPSEVIQGAKEALAEAEKQAEILRDRLQSLL